MKIVIDIPKDEYNKICSGNFDTDGYFKMNLKEAFRNAISLPKGHGDLIDRNELLKHYDSTTYHNGIEERKIHFVQIGYVNDAPTIIEADKEESGEE